MKTITDVFEGIKSDGFELAHFHSADVIFTNPDGKVSVIYTLSNDPYYLKIYLYNSREDYVDKKATSILGRYLDYKTALIVAWNWVKG